MEKQQVNIFLVEDDELDVLNAKRAVRDSQRLRIVAVANDGVDALEALRAGLGTSERLLILLDINMPRMNGIEFLRELRADNDLRHLSVVILSTSSDNRDREEAYSSNVAGYLVKPTSFRSFSESIQAIEDYWSRVELPPN